MKFQTFVVAFLALNLLTVRPARAEKGGITGGGGKASAVPTSDFA